MKSLYQTKFKEERRGERHLSNFNFELVFEIFMKNLVYIELYIEFCLQVI